MKRKVLFALIALFSCLTTWARDVDFRLKYGYDLSANPVLVSQDVEDAPDVTVAENEGSDEQPFWQDLDGGRYEVGDVYTYANGKLTLAESLEAVDNYYIKVTVYDAEGEVDEIAFVPFQTAAYVQPEIVWNRESYNLSVEGEEEGWGMYKFYLKKYPKSYVWDDGAARCWYEDEDHAAWENVYDAENGQLKEGYSYDWNAIFWDYPANQLLADFPTIGYAYTGDIPVKAQYGYMFDNGDYTNFKRYNGLSKRLEKNTSVIAKWSELTSFYDNYFASQDPYSFEPEALSLVGGAQMPSKIDLAPENQGYGDVFNRTITNEYTTVLAEALDDNTYKGVQALMIELTPADAPADPYDLQEAARGIIGVDWTMAPSNKIYRGYAYDPEITVEATDVDGNELDPIDPLYDSQYEDLLKVRYFTDAALENEVDEMTHVGTYYVQVYYKDGFTLEENDDQEFDEVDNWVAFGDPKKFTIRKKSYLVIDLAQVHMQYGDNESTIPPLYNLSGNVDEDPVDEFVIDGLGYVKRGPNYVGVDLVAGAVIQYTTTGIPRAFTGRTYKEDGSIDFKGYEDYEIRVLTNNAQLIADPGELRIEWMEDALYKIYGEKDPDFNAVYQGDDEDADYYTEDEELIGKPVYYRAYNQSGEEINYVKDPIIIAREKAAEYNEEGELVSAEGEDVNTYDIYVTTTPNYILKIDEETTEADAEHITSTIGGSEVVTQYKWTLDDLFVIDPFDISTDVAIEAVEDDPETTEIDESVEGQAEKFIIAVNPVTYNADTQFPDAEITFNHEVLGVINLTYNVDAETGEKTPIVPFVKKWHEDGDNNAHGVYQTENYTYTKAAKGYNYSDGTIGTYSGEKKNVKRDADDPAVIVNGASMTVTGLHNFVNEKTQPYAIQPKDLSVKVKGSAEMAFAGATPNFGIELDPEGEFGWPTKEKDADQTTVLTGLGRAITAFDPNGEYGYTYDGGVGIYDGAEEEGHKAKIGVKDAAKAAKNVILAASNYTPIFKEDAVTVTPINLAFKPSTQTKAYPEPVDEAYTKPVINSEIILSRPAVYYTQEEINAAQDGDDAFGKTTDDVKEAAVEGTIELVGDLPEGFDYDMLQALIAPLYAKVNQNDVTKTCKKDGENWIPNANALSIDRKKQIDPETGEPTEEDVVNPTGYVITEAKGDLIITPLTSLYLSYASVAQALEDHKGQTMEEVFMPNRDLKNDTWYTFVLPFTFDAPEFASEIKYGIVEVLDEAAEDGDVHFKATVMDIDPNQPFIVKINAGKTTGGVQKEMMQGDALALCSFKNKLIADVPMVGTTETVVDPITGEEEEIIGERPAEAGDEGYFAYNKDEYAPRRVDGAGNEFIGLYKKALNKLTHDEWFLYDDADNMWWRGDKPASGWRIYPTEAYVFTPERSGAAPRFFIEDEDGTPTDITGVESEFENAANGFAEGWYTINGIKLEAEPTTTGTYIYNGKKVFIKK